MLTSKKIGVLALVVAVLSASTPAFAKNYKPKLVSLDSCADQIVLHLADDEQILALSQNSQLAFSYHKERAEKFSFHKGSAEEVLSLSPDIALRTGIGDYALGGMLSRLGIKTIATGLPDNIAGIKGDIAIFGEAMGQEARAEQLIAEIDARYEAVVMQASDFSHLKALYLSPGGTTTGKDTFVGEVISISGLTNLMAESLPGWGQIDLERLVSNPPDVIVGSFFDAQVGNSDLWRFSSHPVVEQMMADVQFVNVPSKFLACPQWMMLEAVEFIQKSIKERGLKSEK